MSKKLLTWHKEAYFVRANLWWFMAVGLHWCFWIIMLTWMCNAVVSWMSLDKPLAENTPDVSLHISDCTPHFRAWLIHFLLCVLVVWFVVFPEPSSAAATYYSQKLFRKHENIHLLKHIHLIKVSRTTFSYLFLAWMGGAWLYSGYNYE